MFDPEVDTTTGTLRGFAEDDLIHWRGVPYAAAPVGPLRFRAPEPHAGWRGVRDASTYGAVAPQRRTTASFGAGRRSNVSEDCLTLNITVPKLPADAPRPVMVFIHGGANTLGSGSVPMYDGVELVRRGDIVYVSISYRLGVLGFMDFSAYSTPGRPLDSNLGLRDQVAALRWIHQNIASFGGDTDRITIFGESAGAMAVTTLMATPSAHGLFARAISQSPAPAIAAFGANRMRQVAADFLELAGISQSSAAERLSAVEPSYLIKALDKLAKKYAQEQPGTNTAALSIDGDFLPKHPIDAFADGSAVQVPLIIGTNDREGTLFDKFGGDLPTSPALIDRMFHNSDPAARDRVVAAYDSYPDKRAAIDLGGDYVFWWPSVQVADAHSAHSTTYAYRYDYATRLLKWTGFDATHGTELFPLFGKTKTGFARILTIFGGSRALESVGARMRDHWLLFARTGQPDSGWPAYAAHERRTLIFNKTDEIVRDPRWQRREAWTGYKAFQ